MYGLMLKRDVLHMQRLLNDDLNGNGQSLPASPDSAAAPLLQVLWHRRWTLVVTMLVCGVCAGIYLLLTAPTYRSSARVFIERNSPRVYSGVSATPMHEFENYLRTQVDAIQSSAVLRRALDLVHYRDLRTFEKMKSDPVAWMQRTPGFKVEVVNKADLISVSMESNYSSEAAEIVNAVVRAYMLEQIQQRRSTGNDMLHMLQQERDALLKQREEHQQAMLDYKRKSGVLSFDNTQGNILLERTTTLATSLNNAELEVWNLKAQEQAVKAAMATPESLSAYVQALQAQSGESKGDKEYDELRSQLLQHVLSLSTNSSVQGRNNQNVKLLESRVEALKSQVAEKERAIAQGYLVELGARLMAARENEKQLRAAFTTQQNKAIELSPNQAEYLRLQVEVARLEKQTEIMESRIAEVALNTLDSGPLNIQLLEPARAETKPIRPKKALTLAAALLAGWVIGLTIALVQEWQEARLRTPEEIVSLLRTPIVSMIPRINPQLSPTVRGQIVRLDARSPVAEAFRSARASLNLGPGGKAKTILLASPTSGDGKSMTASNLAIAFAQAGERVLLLDCDLRQPVQHLIFELNTHAGLSGVMSGEAKLRDVIQPTQEPNLYVLPSGQIPENPSELLGSKKFARLMESLCDSFDRIIIDSPPVMNVADARILAASADATLLVLRMNLSVRKLGIYALQDLYRVGANVLGAIANDVPARPEYGYYGGSWSYASGTQRMLTAGTVPAQARAGRAIRANGAVKAKAHANGNGHAHNADAPVAVDVVTINEPDWPAADARA